MATRSPRLQGAPACGLLSFHPSRDMKTNLTRLALTAALTAGLATPAFAADGGIYIGADLGRSSLKNDQTTRNKLGPGLTLGYEFNEHFAVEGQVRRLAHWSEDGFKFGFDSMNLSLIGKLPLGSDFSLYGRLGAARTKSSFRTAQGATLFSATRTKAVYGVGGEYALTPRVSLRTEYASLGSQRVGNDAGAPVVKIRQLSLGITYQF